MPKKFITKKLSEKQSETAIKDWAQKNYPQADARTIQVRFAHGLFGFHIEVSYTEKSKKRGMKI